MASIHGGLFQSAAAAHVTATARPEPGALSLASVTGGAAASSDPRFAGNLPAGTDQVTATQTQVGGNIVVSLADGSTITIIGHPNLGTIIH
jgi:ferric-dicitrate binding protein FerR (iron transport regulator)